VIEPGDNEPWIDNGSVPESKKPKQLEEQTRIHLDMVARRGKDAWDGSEEDRQQPDGGDLPKAEAPQGATEAPEAAPGSPVTFDQVAKAYELAGFTEKSSNLPSEGLIDYITYGTQDINGRARRRQRVGA
jgi:hypothetical protein